MQFGIPISNAMALSILLPIVIVACVFAVLQTVGKWMTLQKMGRHDFAALVPVYGTWELARGTGLKPGGATGFTIFYVLVCGGAGFANAVLESRTMYYLRALAENSADPLSALSTYNSVVGTYYLESLKALDPFAIAAVALPVVALVLTIYLLYGVSKSFGHGVGFMLGLLILPAIFFAILGCSRNQSYVGPLRDKDYLANPRYDWTEIVRSRIDTFGSNAPLALAVIGLIYSACFMPIPALVFSIIALARNTGEKYKPLATAKSRGTVIVAVVAILLSIALTAFFYFVFHQLTLFGYIANGAG